MSRKIKVTVEFFYENEEVMDKKFGAVYEDWVNSESIGKMVTWTINHEAGRGIRVPKPRHYLEAE